MYCNCECTKKYSAFDTTASPQRCSQSSPHSIIPFGRTVFVPIHLLQIKKKIKKIKVLVSTSKEEQCSRSQLEYFRSQQKATGHSLARKRRFFLLHMQCNELQPKRVARFTDDGDMIMCLGLLRTIHFLPRLRKECSS